MYSLSSPVIDIKLTCSYSQLLAALREFGVGTSTRALEDLGKRKLNQISPIDANLVAQLKTAEGKAADLEERVKALEAQLADSQRKNQQLEAENAALIRQNQNVSLTSPPVSLLRLLDLSISCACPVT